MDQHLTEKVISLVREAGKKGLEIYSRGFEVTHKEKGEGPVTEADHALNEFLTTSLQKLFPEDQVVGEESNLSVSHLPERTWWIDPIDGTQAFIEGSGQWSVLVGLAEKGIPTFGIVYQPETGELYYAGQGKGAWKERKGETQKLQVRSLDRVEEATLAVSRYHPSSKALRFAESLGIQSSYAHGSVGLKVVQIAEQRADLYFNFSKKCHRWDTCAGEVILKEAGGILALRDGKFIPYQESQTRVEEVFVAGTAGLVPEVLKRLADFHR